MRLHTDASDPVCPVRPIAPADAESAFEKRLLDDIRQLGSAWSIARETAALEIGTGTFVPDFTLARGSDRVYVEIAGFHTVEYLAAKLEETRHARLSNVIVCVDDALACSDGRVEAAEIFRFRGTIDAARLLQIAESRLSA